MGVVSSHGRSRVDRKLSCQCSKNNSQIDRREGPHWVGTKNVYLRCLFHTNRRMSIFCGVSESEASVKVDRASGTSCAGKQVRIEECANEDSRFPSWLKPSRTINCLPKISAPTPGRQATVPAVPPLLVMCVLVQAHARTDSPEFLFLR